MTTVDVVIVGIRFLAGSLIANELAKQHKSGGYPRSRRRRADQ